jgi:hypothetical protein
MQYAVRSISANVLIILFLAPLAPTLICMKNGTHSVPIPIPRLRPWMPIGAGKAEAVERSRRDGTADSCGLLDVTYL